MELHERELRVARILAGRVDLKVGPSRFAILEPPAPSRRAFALEIQAEALTEAEAAGLPGEDEARASLVDLGLLNPNHEEEAAKLAASIDEAKVRLCVAFDDPAGADEARRDIARLRVERAGLAAGRDALYPQTREAHAAAARMRAAVGASLVRGDGTPHWPDPWAGYAAPDDGTLEAAVAALAADRPTEAQYRLLARTEPWQGVWRNRSHGDGMVGRPPSDWGEPLRALAHWAETYERVLSHPERPDPALLEDDDALDGWILLKTREATRGRGPGRLDSIRSEKIRNSGEIFLAATTPEEAAAIGLFNSAAGAALRRERFKQVGARKVVRESLPHIDGVR